MSLNELVKPLEPLDIKVNDLNVDGDLNMPSGTVIVDTINVNDVNADNADIITGNVTNLNATTGTVTTLHSTSFSFLNNINQYLQHYSYDGFIPSLTFGGSSGGTGITYTSRDGYELRLGEMVTVSIKFVLSSKGSATGSALLQPLSWQPNPEAAAIGVVSFSGIDLTSGYYNIVAEMDYGVNPNKISLMQVSNVSSNLKAPVTNANFTNTSSISLCMTYITGDPE